MDIPKRLRKLREARGWNVSELARASGLSQPYLRQIELGIKRNPSAAVLNQLAAALGVTVADIMGASVAIPGSSLEEAPDSLRELVRKSRHSKASISAESALRDRRTGNSSSFFSRGFWAEVDAPRRRRRIDLSLSGGGKEARTEREEGDREADGSGSFSKVVTLPNSAGPISSLHP